MRCWWMTLIALSDAVEHSSAASAADRCTSTSSSTTKSQSVVQLHSTLGSRPAVSRWQHFPQLNVVWRPAQLQRRPRPPVTWPSALDSLCLRLFRRLPSRQRRLQRVCLRQAQVCRWRHRRCSVSAVYEPGEYKALVTLSRLGVPSSHDLRVTDHCRPDFSLERTGPLPTFYWPFPPSSRFFR